MLLWGALVGVTLLRLAIAATLPLTPDEAYYWIWSRNLQTGYLDHPPMVALWIRAGTAIAGQTAFGVRWLGPVSALAGSWLIARAAQILAPVQGGALRSAVLLNATLMVGLGAMTMTPDTPLLFFVAVAIWSVAQLLRRDDARWWLAVGACFGLACESKYTGFLAAAGCAVWWLGTRRLWKQGAWVVAGGIVGGLVVLPTLLWNAHHHWASFAKQGGRAADWHSARAAQFLGELLGGQIALATPLVFVLFLGGLWQAARYARSRETSRFLIVCAGLPMAVFVQHAFGDRVQPNWPAVTYPFLVLAAAASGQKVRAACVVGGVMTTVVYAQALFSPLPLTAHQDVIARQTRGWDLLARDIQALRSRDSGSFVVADDYAVTSALAFHGAGLPMAGIEPRWGLLSLPMQAGAGGIFVIRAGGRVTVPVGWKLGQLKGHSCRMPGLCYDLYPLTPEAGVTTIWRIPTRA